MSAIARSLALLALFCVILSVGASSKKSLSKNYHFPKGQLIFDRRSFKGTNLSYALCNDVTEASEKHCSIVIESNSFDDYSSRESKCNVTLKTGDKDQVVDTYVRVVPLGESKAIFLWVAKDKMPTESVDVRLTVVHFSTCKSDEYKLDVQGNIKSFHVLEDIEVITYEDNFDVAFRNPTLCGPGFCRLHIDAVKQDFETPVEWFASPKTAFIILEPIAHQSRSKGHLLIEFKNSLEASLLAADGKKTSLRTFTDNHEGDWSIAYSTAQEIVGVCSQLRNTTSFCSQYDLEGHQTLNTTVVFPYKMLLMAQHNLPNGGFLLITTQCQADSSCRGSQNRYHVEKISADGRKASKSMEIEGFECNSGENAVTAQFFENGKGEYCFTLVCFETEDALGGDKEAKGRFSFVGKCFTDKELA